MGPSRLPRSDPFRTPGFAHEVNYYQYVWPFHPRQSLSLISLSLQDRWDLHWRRLGLQGGLGRRRRDLQEDCSRCQDVVHARTQLISGCSSRKLTLAQLQNIANLQEYETFFPDDVSTVDLIGVDWYVSDGNTDFLAGMQGFHDKYSQSGRISRSP